MKNLFRVMAVVIVIATANFASAFTNNFVNAKAGSGLARAKRSVNAAHRQSFSYNFQVKSYGASSTMFLMTVDGTSVTSTIETAVPYSTISFNSSVTPDANATVVMELRGGYTPRSATLGTYLTNVIGVINTTAGTITFSNVNITTKQPGLLITLE